MIHDRFLRYSLMDKGFRYNPDTDIWTWHIEPTIKMTTTNGKDFDVVTKVVPEGNSNVLDNLQEIADYVRGVEQQSEYQLRTETIMNRIFKP